MRTIKFLVVLLALFGTSLIGWPAQAETELKRDQVGDAPARIDIRRVTYTYGNDRVTVAARIPDLGTAGRADLSITRFEIFEAGYVLRIVKRRGTVAKVRLLYFDHFSLKRRECAGAGGQWNDSSIRLKVPTDCLTGHARPRVRVQFGIEHGERLDRAPAVRRLARD